MSGMISDGRITHTLTSKLIGVEVFVVWRLSSNFLSN